MKSQEGGMAGAGADSKYNQKSDLPQAKGTGPYRKQREKDGERDGMAKVGCQYNEIPQMEGSLAKAGALLQKADSIDHYRLEGSYGKDKGAVR